MSVSETRPKYLQRQLGRHQYVCPHECGWIVYGDRPVEVEGIGGWHGGRCRHRPRTA